MVWLGDSKKPTEQLMDLLMGRVSHEESPESIRSLARLEYYKAAVDILKLPQQERKAALQELPEHVRVYVQNEVIRIWEYRRNERTRF